MQTTNAGVTLVTCTSLADFNRLCLLKLYFSLTNVQQKRLFCTQKAIKTLLLIQSKISALTMQRAARSSDLFQFPKLLQSISSRPETYPN